MENIPGVLDLILLGLSLLFFARGLARGLAAEVGGVLSILLAVLASGNNTLHDLAAGWIAALLPDPGWADLAAYVGVFLVVLLVARMVFQILDSLAAGKLPGWLDRSLGGLIGLVKGFLACTLVLICLAYAAPASNLRAESRLAPYFNSFWAQMGEFSGGSYRLPRL